MSRRRRELGLLAAERWPLLADMMIRRSNQDFDLLHDSLGGAIAGAAAEGLIEHRRSILQEGWDWNSPQGAVHDIRPFLEYGFRVAVPFETALEAGIS